MGTSGLAGDQSDAYKVILSDGTAMNIQWSDSELYVGDGYFQFDLDGPNKGRNTLGVDIFEIQLHNNKLGVAGNPNADACRKLGGAPCAGWILTYDNADYINCSGLTENNIQT